MTLRDPGLITPADWVESESAINRVEREGRSLAPSHRVRAVIRCNQPRRGFVPCDWTETVETTAGRVDDIAARKLRAHIGAEHPTADAALITSRRVSLLRGM
jgi:hypothetical protein